MIETDRWPFVPARWFGDVPAATPRRVRVIVIHDMEYPEKSTAAEDVARYFATTPTPASAHICVDNTSIVQCVKDSDVAYAAPGCNHDGIQIELAGYARQTRGQWIDEYGVGLLERAANATAQYCLKYGIPPVHLTNEQLRAGAKGIVGHVQVSQVYQKSTHTDPGPNFPWDIFLGRVAVWHARRQANHT
jgi:N-acetyl-anhydromuramyl-L-alanine amidase AmpD